MLFRSDYECYHVPIEDLRISLANKNKMLFDPRNPFIKLKPKYVEGKIKNIIGGNSADGSRIVVEIRRNDDEGISTIVSWDLKMQQEINQYRVEDPFQVCFDDKGMVVIVRDSVITVDDRCTKFTAFDFDNELLDEAK